MLATLSARLAPGVYQARPEVLQGRVPKTFKLFPVSKVWYPEDIFGCWPNSTYCSAHEPYCIVIWHTWSDFFASGRDWRLKTKIDVKGTMPGTDHKLTHVRIDSMYQENQVGWAWVWANTRKFAVLNADTREVLWKVEGDQIMQKKNEWVKNEYEPNVEVWAPRLDAWLRLGLLVRTGWMACHYANMILTFEYVPKEPPEPATVRVYVYDRQTSKPIEGAYVALLSGNKVVADGRTRRDGWAVLNNVPAGVEGISYTLKVRRDGYQEYSDAVEVKPGVNEFGVALVPLPSPPPPDWLKWAIIGGIVIVVGGTAMAYARRKAEKPMVVVTK